MRDYGNTNSAFIGPTAPVAPEVGQIWWRSDPDQNLYVYYDDGNTKQWVVATPVEGMWLSSGATLTPADATKRLAIPGPTATGADQSNIVLGSSTVKTRLGAFVGADVSLLSVNRYWDGSAYQRDNTSKAAWILFLDAGGDALSVLRTSPAGATTTPLLLDNAGNETILGQLRVGVGPVFTDLTGANTNTGLQYNNWAAPQDINKCSWLVQLEQTTDKIYFYHRAPGVAAGNVTGLFTFDGSGNLVITGPNATKASGTTWINPSDKRMKRNVADYATGLGAICQLRPVRFEYNGKFGTVDTGQTCYGFLAQDVEPVMPECVGASDYEGTSVKTLDQSNVILALVNAVKELAAQVAVLEAKVDGRS